MRTRPASSEAVESVTIGSADSKQYDLPRLAQEDGKVVADATKRGPKPREDAPLPRFYRVQETRGISQDGYRAQIQAGKVVNDGSYDITALKRQGVKLDDLGQFTHENAPI
jgi:hypothetical protein